MSRTTVICLIVVILCCGSVLSQRGGGKGKRSEILTSEVSRDTIEDKPPMGKDHVNEEAEGETETAKTHEEWIKLVRREVTSLNNHRVSRSPFTEPAYDIVDLQQHYRNAFAEVQNMATGQGNEKTRELYVSGRYIVFMSEDSNDSDLNKVIRVLRKYSRKDKSGRFVANHFSTIRHVGKGFTATLSSKVVNVLRRHPATYTVENDVVLQRSSHFNYEDIDSVNQILAQEQDEDNGIEIQGLTPSGKATTQSTEWNLDRIDQRSLPLDKKFNPKGNGKGVDVYILDTGIRYSHNEFGGRAKYSGYDAIDALVSSSTPQKGNDCNSHGTHCAATIGGKTFGVAKAATLYSSRVLDCSGTGSVSGIIHAMNHIIGTRQKSGKSKKTAVLSMSLGVKRSTGFNSAVDKAVKMGVVIVSASGNQMGDSCNYSPGSAELSISVAASSQDDTSTSFSNIGRCTDVFAPGYSIHSASNECDSCTTTKSGTSMACPHVAGYAAIVLGSNPNFTPAQVKAKMISDATTGKIHFNDRASLASLTPNRLLYVGKTAKHG